MGLIKGLGSFAGKLAGGVVGGAVEFVGEVTNNNFIKEVGQSVYQVSSKSGELLGSLAEGTIDTVEGIISHDDYLRNKGTRQFLDAAGDTITGVANGIVTVAKQGINTAVAILDDNKGKEIESGNDLVKIAAVGVLPIGVVDGLDDLDEIDVDDTLDFDFNDDYTDNYTYREESYDEDGYDQYGYDREGYDESGNDEFGYDEDMNGAFN